MTPPLPPPPRRRSSLQQLGHGLNMVRLIIINVVFFAFLAIVLILVVAATAADEHGVQPDSVLVLKPQGQLVEQYSAAPMQRALSRLSAADVGQVDRKSVV